MSVVEVNHALLLPIDLLHRLMLLPQLYFGMDLVSNVGVHLVYLLLVVHLAFVWGPEGHL